MACFHRDPKAGRQTSFHHPSWRWTVLRDRTESSILYSSRGACFKRGRGHGYFDSPSRRKVRQRRRDHRFSVETWGALCLWIDKTSWRKPCSFGPSASSTMRRESGLRRPT